MAQPTSAGTTARAPIQITPYTTPSASVPSCPRATHTRKRAGERRSGVPGWPSGSSLTLRPCRRRRPVRTELPGGGEAELDAGEEELAPLPQVALVGGPGGGLGGGDAVVAGDVVLDQGQDGGAVGVGGELGGGEGVALGADVAEPGRTQPRRQGP